MSKSYFSHDADAHRDIRVLEMRAQFGWEGYGWFWAIVETMREQETFKLPWNPQLLAFKLGISDFERFSNFLERCVSLKLFSRDDSFFWADSLLERMQQMQRLSRKRSASAKQMHSKCKANAQQVQSNCTGNRNINININKDLTKDLSGSMPASSDAAHTPSEKIRFGDFGFVWFTGPEVEKLKTVLGDDGFNWCVNKLDSWIHSQQPERGRRTAKAEKAIRNGQNARHTFDSWVIKSWNEEKTSRNREATSALYAKRSSGPDLPRHIQQSINYTDALLAEARRLDAEDEKQKKLMVN